MPSSTVTAAATWIATDRLTRTRFLELGPLRRNLPGPRRFAPRALRGPSFSPVRGVQPRPVAGAFSFERDARNQHRASPRCGSVRQRTRFGWGAGRLRLNR
jgi:hypothetical protein